MPSLSKELSNFNINKLILFLVLAGLVVFGFLFLQEKMRENYATNAISNFVNENLMAQFKPLSFSAKKIVPQLPIYANVWQLKNNALNQNVTVFTSLHYNFNNDSVRKIVISVKFPVQLNNVSADSVSKVVYKDVHNGWRCITTAANDTICESFWVNGTSKKGIVFITGPNNTFIQMCEIPQGSDIYNINTCSIFR